MLYCRAGAASTQGSIELWISVAFIMGGVKQ